DVVDEVAAAEFEQPVDPPRRERADARLEPREALRLEPRLRQQSVFAVVRFIHRDDAAEELADAGAPFERERFVRQNAAHAAAERIAVERNGPDVVELRCDPEWIEAVELGARERMLGADRRERRMQRVPIGVRARIGDRAREIVGQPRSHAIAFCLTSSSRRAAFVPSTSANTLDVCAPSAGAPQRMLVLALRRRKGALLTTNGPLASSSDAKAPSSASCGSSSTSASVA